MRASTESGLGHLAMSGARLCPSRSMVVGGPVQDSGRAGGPEASRAGPWVGHDLASDPVTDPADEPIQ